MSMAHLVSSRKARLWLDELPPIAVDPTRWIEGNLPARQCVQERRRLAAIEILIPMGARFVYGLLGAELTPCGSDQLSVVVGSSERGLSLTEWALARGLDDVRAGIPPWAAPSILNSVLEMPDTPLLGAGRLVLALGAHGQIGSNSWVFSRLAGAIILVFLSKDNGSLQDLLTSVLKRQFG